MLILIYFSKSQNHINYKVDVLLTTPPDYTIMVENIPSNINNFQYESYLKNFFSKEALNNTKYDG